MVVINNSGGITNDDRRRHPRVSTQFGIAVQHKKGTGAVIDVSTQGASFSYVQWQNEAPRNNNFYDYISISSSENGLIVDKIPCRIISDDPVAPFAPMPMFMLRRMGVEFFGLTQEQQRKIDAFQKIARRSEESHE